MVAVQRNLSKFGIKEIARTGKIALRRGKMGASAPFWRFSAASYPDLEETAPVNPLAGARGGCYPVESPDGFTINQTSGHQSHTLSMLEVEGISRITTVIPGTDESISKLVQQLYKLVDMHEVRDLTPLLFAERELMLIKIAVNTATRRDVLDIANIFRAKAVNVSDHTVTLELTGDRDKMVALQRLLESYGICEVARTGRIALVRESGV